MSFVVTSSPSFPPGLKFKWNVRVMFTVVRKIRFHMEKLNCQSRPHCASTRRAIAVHHLRSETCGASGGRRYLTSSSLPELRSRSGIPMQYLKQKENATPKYQGWNWSNIALPVQTSTCGTDVSAEGGLSRSAPTMCSRAARFCSFTSAATSLVCSNTTDNGPALWKAAPGISLRPGTGVAALWL